MQRAGLESILGLQMSGAFVRFDPCIPKSWPGFVITFRYRSARYEVSVDNPDGVSRGISSAQLDDKIINERPLRLRLVDDGITHHVRVRLGVSPGGVADQPSTLVTPA